MQRRDDLRALLEDLEALPDDQRAALLLAELQALTHEEIAEVLAVSPKKVKALTFQARSAHGRADRDARGVPCHEIRRQLSALSGASLRRAPLRRHLRVCTNSCRQYRDELKQQKAALAAIMPVARRWACARPCSAPRSAPAGRPAARGSWPGRWR